jgi:hypothetical protein
MTERYSSLWLIQGVCTAHGTYAPGPSGSAGGARRAGPASDPTPCPSRIAKLTTYYIENY